MTDNVRRIVEANTSMIDQLGLNRHWRYVEVIRDFVLFFLRVIPAQHLFHKSEWAQELRSERSLCLLSITGNTCCRKQGFSRRTSLCLEQTITDEAGKIEALTRLPARPEGYPGAIITVECKRYFARMPALTRNCLTHTSREACQGGLGNRLPVQALLSTNRLGSLLSPTPRFDLSWLQQVRIITESDCIIRIGLKTISPGDVFKVAGRHHITQCVIIKCCVGGYLS